MFTFFPVDMSYKDTTPLELEIAKQSSSGQVPNRQGLVLEKPLT